MATTADSTPLPDALRLRRLLEQTVERALELLDRLDGDADLEPSLAMHEVRAWECQATAWEHAPWAMDESADLEVEDEREPDDAA